MKKRTTLLALLAAVFILAPVCFMLAREALPLWHAAAKLKSSIASVSHAQSLTIHGDFIDYEYPTSKQTVSVVLTNPTDVAAIAALFQSAAPKLDYRLSRAFAQGAGLTTCLHGTIIVALDKTTNELVFLGTDLLLGDAHAAVRLDGFSSLQIYETLKTRQLWKRVPQEEARASWALPTPPPPPPAP